MIKTKFRKSLKHQLSLMSESEIIKKSANIQSRCINYIDSVDHYNVLIYMPFRSEVRTNILIEELFSNKKEVYIPKILRGNTLCFNKFFDGIHPIFKHVPPNVSRDSTHAVFNPNCADLIAATYPAGPDPIIITSKLLSIIKDLEIISLVLQDIL